MKVREDMHLTAQATTIPEHLPVDTHGLQDIHLEEALHYHQAHLKVQVPVNRQVQAPQHP
jgi:hypothetical protein